MREENPSQILKILLNHGHEAYYVGGCVRDTLLERPIHDWDITTSALPEETMACFSHCIPTGVQHGTVTVLLGGVQAEVTTYRTDGAYIDGRHPTQVSFVRSLREDLARRDFTINAMAMSADGTVTDLYGGQADLDAKVIRCVGEPERRFREDALRMLRAFRFSAQLGFEIEQETLRAIAACAALCSALSVERVRDEVEKTLLSPHPERLLDMAELGLLNHCDPDPEKSCEWLAELPQDRVVRWAGLCRAWPRLDLVKMRLDKRSAADAMAAGRCTPPQARLEWKRLIAAQGIERARIVAALEHCTGQVEAILSSGECLSLRELAVKGSDIPELRGPAVGAVLRNLLDHVLEHPMENERKKLLEIYKNSIDYRY